MLTILAKEFRETFRDRRTIISVIISPLLVTPAMFALMGGIIGSESKKEMTRVYPVGIVADSSSISLQKSIGEIQQLQSHLLSKSEAEHQIASKQITAAVVIPESTAQLSALGTPVPIEIMFDAGDESSQSAAHRLSNGLKQIGDHIVSQRLRANNLPPGFAAPFKVSENPIKAGGNMASLMLASMLPYLLVISSFGGGIYSAFDQVAGEKERGTLETLLVSPASRREIVMGKFGAVAGVCIISSVLSVVGMILSFSLHSSIISSLNNGGLHLSGAAIIISLLMMLPLAILFSGVLLSVSTFARNQKEAQTYITPILLIVLMPAMFSVFIRTDVPQAMALVPILGTSIIIKQAFGGVYNAGFILIAFASSLLYGWLAVQFCTRLFEKESVLIKA